MYKALKTFRDLQDNAYKYQAGDIFPREGLSVSDERIEELSTSNNRRGEPMIAEVLEEPEKEDKKSTPKKGNGRKKAK